MNNLQNNKQSARERRSLSFFIEFVKFTTGFAIIVAVALFMLNVASAAMQ